MQADIPGLIDEQITTNGANQISGAKINAVLKDVTQAGTAIINVNNINTKAEAYDDAATARAAVPESMRKAGAKITYLLAAGWMEDQFNGADISGWDTASNWKTTGPVSVSQNAETGHTEIYIGDKKYDIPSIFDFNSINLVFAKTIQFIEGNGYYGSNGVIVKDATFHNSFADIKVIQGNSFIITNISRIGNSNAPNVLFFNGNSFVSKIDSITNSQIVVVPSGVNRVIFTCWDSISNDVNLQIQPFNIQQSVEQIFASKEDFVSFAQNNKLEKNTNLNLVDGFVDYTDGSIARYSEDSKYQHSDLLLIQKGFDYTYNGTFKGYAGVAFYDGQKQYISGYNTNPSNHQLVIPNTAVYMCLSDYKEDADHSSTQLIASVGASLQQALSDIVTLEIDVSILQNQNISNQQKIQALGVQLNSQLFMFEQVGYYGSSGDIINDKGFHNFSSKVFSVNSGDSFIINSISRQGNSNAPNVIFYNNGAFVSKINAVSNNQIVIVPSNVNEVLFTCWGDIQNGIAFEVSQIFYKENINNTKASKRGFEQFVKNREIKDAIALNFIDGYVDYSNGTISTFSDNGKYAVSALIPINKEYQYKYSGTFKALAGVAFYNAQNEYISGYHDNDIDHTLTIPTNAAYLRLSDFNENADHSDALLYEILQGTQKFGSKEIICLGDSITEGMAMQGGGYARYGQEPYPAQLNTMMIDKGYHGYQIINEGQGGETVPCMALRAGAFGGYIVNEVTLPQDTSWVELGSSDYLGIHFPDLNGVDYKAKFTVAKPVTTPIFIDGNFYDLKVVSSSGGSVLTCSIKKQSADNTAHSIPAGSLVITPMSKTPYLTIVYGGVNGASSLNYEKWSSMMDAILKMNGGRGLVIAFNGIWNWSDLTGSTIDEKYVDLKNKSYKLWGDRFLDLYDLFYRHALQYCLDVGYYADKTQEELEAMQVLLDQHILPAEMSYDYEHQGNVHLSKEGYYAMAKIIFDRLVALKYIRLD